MTIFQLRTRRDQGVVPAPGVLLDWFSGGGSTIQARLNLTSGLRPPPIAVDFLRFAAAVYCADRLAVRPGTWTRSIDLGFPVRGPAAWRGTLSDLVETLAFLTGDKWRLVVLPTNETSYDPRLPQNPVDAVCLFSGGLDSFTGAVNLLAEGKRVCLVAHYEGGQAPETQQYLVRQLTRRYGAERIVFRHLFLRPAPRAAAQTRPLPEAKESSMRSRSLLFLAAGLIVASGYGPNVPLYIPENGFIGINVPLTAARSGSLSTRTTHPYFITRLIDCAQKLSITNPILNPFRLMTKGEILDTCRDPQVLRALARETLSCAHPEASRYASRAQGNCGYCFPCLIRRASLHHAGLDAPDDYAFDALREDHELTGERGSDLRALVRSLNRDARPLDVLRNGPVDPKDVRAFAGVNERGRQEILVWMRTANPSRQIRRQLPVL